MEKKIGGMIDSSYRPRLSGKNSSLLKIRRICSNTSPTCHHHDEAVSPTHRRSMAATSDMRSVRLFMDTVVTAELKM